MFEYDYTLDESGVVTDENTNQQVIFEYHLTKDQTTTNSLVFFFNFRKWLTTWPNFQF